MADFIAIPFRTFDFDFDFDFGLFAPLHPSKLHPIHPTAEIPPRRPASPPLNPSTRHTMLLFVFACLLCRLAAASLTIAIPPSTQFPNPHVLPATTHATLTTLPSASKDHILTASLTRSSTLVFDNLPQGHSESYLLDIRSPGFVFSPYRVDVAADGSVLGVWETYRGNPWDNRGAEKYVVDVAGKPQTDVVVEAKLVGRKGFYEQRTVCKSQAWMVPVVCLGVRC